MPPSPPSSFAIPDNLSNATIIVTVTNGASGLTLSAGKVNGVNGASGPWSVAQQAGSEVLVFQLDWTDPLIPYYWIQRGLWLGPYLVTLSTTSDTATFSAVSTVTNGSIYSDSIVRLQDGVPQLSVVGAAMYDFYFFTPPPTGWPYVTTVVVTWSTGYGLLRVAPASGPRVGPLASDAALLDSAVSHSNTS